MLALRRTAGGIALAEGPDALPPAPGDVIVAVEAASFCADDLRPGGAPVIAGSAFAGCVWRTGTGAGLANGTRVTVLPEVACGYCPACRTGEPRLCASEQNIGWTMDGGCAARVRVPAANCFLLPDGVDAELGALCAVLATAAEALLVGNLRLGDRVAVLGEGAIARALALVATVAGAIAVEADADVALTTPNRVPDAIAALRKDGVVVVAFSSPPRGGGPGWGLGPIVEPPAQSLSFQANLRTSRAAARPTWRRVLELLAHGPDRFRPLITHRLPLTNAAGALAVAHAGGTAILVS